jgi:large subunit ribosomal protein L9
MPGPGGGSAARRFRRRPNPAAPGKYFVDTPSRLRDLVGFPHSYPSTFTTTMAHTEVLLVKPVDGLGGEGDQVRVRAGYARNFLLPSGMALPVTHANSKQIEALKKRRAGREALELSGAQEVAQKLEKTSLAFAVTTGEGGKMFGSVTVGDLHDKLVAAGFSIDRKRIQLHTPVKTLGRHTVKVKLHADVAVDLAFDVVSENPIEPSAEEKAAEDKKNRKGESRR